MSFAISFIPDNTYNVVSQINAQSFEVAPPWRPNSDTIVASGYPNPVAAVEKGGSMLFPGTSGSYLSVPNDIDFRFRTGQFTIEWFQYMTSQTANPRVFTIGSWNTATIGLSIENISGGRVYFWVNGSAGLTYLITSHLNTWVHMVFVVYVIVILYLIVLSMRSQGSDGSCRARSCSDSTVRSWTSG